jgi:hypothetical protein
MLDVEIASSDDWVKFHDDKQTLNTIVDPMIFRTADVFLKGASASDKSKTKSDEGTWRVLRQNIGSLFAFFDAIILEERLPVIDYGFTFERHLGFGGLASDDLPLIKACNESEKVLLNVHVHSTAYGEAKTAAMATMRGRPVYSDQVTQEIASELADLGYEWRPHLEDISAKSDEEEALNAFLFNGLLFSEYAQRTGSTHLVQPKRSRLELAVALPTLAVDAGASRKELEDVLFARLKEIVNEPLGGIQRTVEMPSAPTFLPYLLTFDDSTPRALLRRALKLRKDSLVDEYRQWWKETVRELDNGRIVNDRSKEVQRIASSINRRLDTSDDAAVKAKIQLTNLAVSIGAEFELYYQQIWGWMTHQLPGRRYRKLLMRLIVAEREHVKIERQIRKLWTSSVTGS